MFIKTLVGTCGTRRCHNQDEKQDLKYCIAEDNILEILGGNGKDLSLPGHGAVSSGD
jgi:hypothetical protein